MDGAAEDKVAAICAALRAAMEAAGRRRYLSPILTSHAKQGNLEAALAIVQQLKEEELAAPQQAQRQQQTARQAPSREVLSANGTARHENGHANGHADAADRDAAGDETGLAADVPAAAPGEDAASDADDGEDGVAGIPDTHKSWTAEDGLRHLLLYSDVDKLYRCWAHQQAQCIAAAPTVAPH